RAKRSASSTVSVAAMTPNPGKNAAVRRSANGTPASAPEIERVVNTATKPAARPAKLHGSASRTAATNGSSPSACIRGAIRASKNSRLKAANDGLHPSDDLDIARVDWRHVAILRLQPNAAVL